MVQLTLFCLKSDFVLRSRSKIEIKNFYMDVYQGLCACCCCCCYLWTAGMSDELDVVWADGNKVHERSVYQHRPTHPHNPENSQRNTIARLFVRKWLHLKSSQKLQWTFCGSSLRSTRPIPHLIIKLVSFFVIILPWNGEEGENFAGINSMAWAAGWELRASVSCGGAGPGQAHRRHHQVIVMVRVDYLGLDHFPGVQSLSVTVLIITEWLG